MTQMTEQARKAAAKKFAEQWAGRGYEKGETQKFWLSLLRDVYGVDDVENYIVFEEQIKLGHTGFIDARIPSARVLIEQKSEGVDLSKPAVQSDKSVLTPYQQARRYDNELPFDQRARYIIACNFHEFFVYDMNSPHAAPEIVQLADLPKEASRLEFLAAGGQKAHVKQEVTVSVDAGKLVGRLYDALRAQYAAVLGGEAALSEAVLRDLNKLCVRLVFCFYAEDAGVFGRKNMFRDYLAAYNTVAARDALIKLFRVLDTPEEQRDPFDTGPAAAFPYVNGGLFENCSNKEVPPLTPEIVKLILDDCCEQFDWSDISPTIFGAVFESTLNPDTRRSGGMHYTSVENIHKVIDPLFLNDLRAEFDEICALKTEKSRTPRLRAFHERLASLRFLDPACGSGNFLTETYLSLRRLENELIRVRLGDGGTFLSALNNPVRVSIAQFYGIEINDFAVSVAKTALWIAENQMLRETEAIVNAPLNFLPLKTNAFIVEGNALRLDWESVVPVKELDYIMGNPPFVGTKYQSPSQKTDIMNFCPALKPLDYVTCWYKKASDFIQGTNVKCAFVSTNSITQGEQPAPLWKVLNVTIIFAYRTFQWESEASDPAAVHCVIIGFSARDNGKEKTIYMRDGTINTPHINGYLMENGPEIYIEPRKTPLCPETPEMVYGSKPADGKNLLLTPEERDLILKNTPDLSPYVRRYMGADDLINNRERYCLWLKDCPPDLRRKNTEVQRRLDLVKKSRLTSKKEATRKWADAPYLFVEDRAVDDDYLILPVVSSEKRSYMPIGYVTKDVIANANAQMIPNATLYVFGVLNSNVHNMWMRAVCGRLELRYAYSATIVYNAFPWPDCTPEQREKIEKTAKKILDARALFPSSSLAALYDDKNMPLELRKAHRENDHAVMAAYGFSPDMPESAIVAALMERYQKLTAN